MKASRLEFRYCCPSTFCLHEILQAMRYPLNAHRKELAAAEGARERERELAKEIQEGDLDDDEGMGGDF